VHFTAIVTFVADSSPFLRVSYHYVFRASEVRAYMAVAVLSDGNASETYFVKEPKFAAILRGGTYTHESLYLGRSTTPVRLVGQPTQTYIGMAHKQVEKRDAQNHYPTLFTLQGQTSYVGRTRVSWNHGADNDNPSCATCFNVVMRSYKANSSTQDVGRIGQPTQPWQPTSRSCSETLGLDKWACVAAGQDPAYPRDTRAGTGDNTAWRCGTDNLVDKNGDGKIDDRDASLISAGVTPRRVSLRQWELLGGWTKDTTPSEQSTFSASGVLFHGWEGGRGPHDCEQLERALSVGDTFAAFASYSYGPGWSLG